jgi:hypothetical protein
MFLDGFYYFKAHQEDIVKDHLGEYVAIQGNKILGYYTSRIDGLNAMADRNIADETYIVHKCEPVDAPKLSVVDIDFKVVPAWTH